MTRLPVSRRVVRHLVCLVSAVALGFSSVPAASAAPRAASAGTNGWYWPTGTENLGSMSGWMAYRSANRSWHLAKDIGAVQGSPVYALTDGVVYSAYPDLAGYGPGGGPGGAIVLLMRQDDGTYFKALYGHLYGLKYSKDQKVKAGAVLGYVNGSSPNHLHFGIHPGSALPTDPQHNVFRGHTYDKDQTYGWTDPVAYLKAHGAYVPPAPVSVGLPCLTASAPAGRLVTVSASVTPAHGRGSVVRLERYRSEATGWVLRGSSTMQPGPAAGTWTGRAVFARGTWRVRACFSGDRDHLPGASGYSTVTVR